MAVMSEEMALTVMKKTRHTTLFQHHGRHICRNIFPFLHGLGKRKFELIKAHYITEGLVPRTHGNTGRTPMHALVMENVITFVM